MTLAELAGVLSATGMATVYTAFPMDEDPEIPAPYIAYGVDQTQNFFADGVVYAQILNIRILLYTAKKDLAAEYAVENALRHAGLGWEKRENDLSSDRLYEIEYGVTI